MRSTVAGSPTRLGVCSRVRFCSRGQERGVLARTMCHGALMAEAPRSLALVGVTMGQATGTFRPLCLLTTDGELEARLYAGSSGAAAVLITGDPMVPSEACDKLAAELVALGFTALVQGYREPENEVSCILDALVGVHVLVGLAAGSIALVGYKGGAPVAIEAARVGAHPLGLIEPVARAGPLLGGNIAIWDDDCQDQAMAVAAWLVTL
jgi:hypothetical protein